MQFNDSTELVNQFLASRTRRELALYSQRDNCGIAAADFVTWCESLGLSASRVRGEFIADRPVPEKADFTPAMQKEFRQEGLDFDDEETRQTWIENSSYAHDWKGIPHYWVHIQGNARIQDPCGALQFIETGLASDLSNSRYVAEIAPRHD